MLTYVQSDFLCSILNTFVFKSFLLLFMIMNVKKRYTILLCVCRFLLFALLLTVIKSCSNLCKNIWTINSQYCLITNNQVLSQNAIKLPSLPHFRCCAHSQLSLLYIRVPIPAGLYTYLKQKNASKKIYSAQNHN